MNIAARRRVQHAPRFKVLAELSRVHRKGPRIDVDKLDERASLANGLCCRNKRVRHRDDDVAGLNTRGHQRETQCVGSAVDAHTMCGAAKLCKLFLESLYP